MSIEDKLHYRLHDLPRAYWALHEGNGTLADSVTLSDYDIDPLCPHAPGRIAEIVADHVAYDRADFQRRAQREEAV